MSQTDEAIQDVRDFCGKAWTEYREQAPMHEIMRMSTLLPILLAHIDEQATQITTMQENFTEFMMNGPCDKHSGDNTPPLPEFLKKIDGKCMLCMIEQIATLKAALIADREELIVNGSSYVIWRYQNNIDPIDPNWGLIKSHAKEELAQEYPDIFKEE